MSIESLLGLLHNGLVLFLKLAAIVGVGVYICLKPKTTSRPGLPTRDLYNSRGELVETIGPFPNRSLTPTPPDQDHQHRDSESEES